MKAHAVFGAKINFFIAYASICYLHYPDIRRVALYGMWGLCLAIQHRLLCGLMDMLAPLTKQEPPTQPAVILFGFLYLTRFVLIFIAFKELLVLLLAPSLSLLGLATWLLFLYMTLIAFFDTGHFTISSWVRCPGFLGVEPSLHHAERIFYILYPLFVIGDLYLAFNDLGSLGVSIDNSILLLSIHHVTMLLIFWSVPRPRNPYHQGLYDVLFQLDYFFLVIRFLIVVGAFVEEILFSQWSKEILGELIGSKAMILGRMVGPTLVFYLLCAWARPTHKKSS